tara:strand:+ start:12307 stop:13266 length:960 start_codon:yes stop_codon:yes gene_type:complete
MATRRKSITLAPTALDRNGISTTETFLATRLDFLINGALSTGYDRNGIAASQTPTSSAAMTLDGALGLDFVSRDGVYILIYGAADDTGRTFSVVGRTKNGHTITEQITGPDAGLIVLGAVKFHSIVSVASDAATAGAIEIGVNGYVDLAAAGAPQHFAIYSAGDDRGVTMTAVGKNRYGAALTETITGGNAGTVIGSLNFAKIDRISTSGASAGAVEGGIDGLCESQWFVLNQYSNDFGVSIGVDKVAGTHTYAVQHTYTNVMAPGYTEGDETVFTHSTITSKTADFEGSYTTPPVACRLAFTAFTSGSSIMHVAQSGS